MNIFCLLFLLTGLGLAPGLEIELDPYLEGHTGEAEIVVIDPAREAEVWRKKVSVPGRGSVGLNRSLSGLRVEIHSPDFWAAPRFIEQDDASGKVMAIELFPQAELVFSEVPTLENESADAKLLPIAVDISSVPVARGTDKLSKTRLLCRLESERWHCPAPALSLDLRLEKPQHVPRYLFGTTLEAGKILDLGRIRFERGASISGYVTAEEGEPEGTRIQVDPAGTTRALGGQRSDLRQLDALAGDRGFFQVHGVAPGGYRIEATRAGLSPVAVDPVDVLEGQETLLPEPLYLPRLAEIELHLSPPLGPLGKPWKLILARKRQEATVAPIEGIADEKGVWVQKDLRNGTYILNVYNPDGEKTGSGADSIWMTMDVDLVAGGQPVFLDLPSVEVVGTFRAGDEPLRGRLIFGGFFGAPHVAIWSDEDGDFQGFLPGEGEWQLDVEIDAQRRTLPPVKVEKRGGRPARLDIRLPNSRFHGNVTYRGKPVAGADIWGVSTTRPDRTAQFSIKSDDQGLFDLRGLDLGQYAITASSARLELGAPQLRVDIREDADEPFEIELEEFVQVDGQVLAGGQGVPGASFRARLKARNGEDLRSGSSDLAGVFGLVLPESTTSVSLLVAAQGFAWELTELRPRNVDGRGFDPFVIEVAQNGATLQLAGENLESAQLAFEGAEIPMFMLKRSLEGGGYFEQQGERILLKNASPGFYRLCVVRACSEGVASPGGTLMLELDSQPKIPPADPTATVSEKSEILPALGRHSEGSLK